MSNRSAAAVARSAGTDRVFATLLGLIALLGGAAVLLVGGGVLGAERASRPLIDPVVVDAVTGNRPLVLGIAIGVGIVLFTLGLWWVARSVRPERRPDLVLDPSPAAGLTVTAGALSGAIRADAESVPGVDRARVRMVGSAVNPALRISLWLEQGADLRAVWDDLDTRVLARARDALGVEHLPTAVRIELDSTGRQRVD